MPPEVIRKTAKCPKCGNNMSADIVTGTIYTCPKCKKDYEMNSPRGKPRGIKLIKE